VSLSERAGTLGAVRAGIVTVVVALAVADPSIVEVRPVALASASVAYLALLATPWAVARSSRRLARAVLGAGLLLDGVYLAWVAYATGGTQSPTLPLALAHVGAVTVLASGRTGLKLAAWHSLLHLVALWGQAAALVPVHERMASALPGGAGFPEVTLVQVGALWAIALATAAAAATSERELRAQKTDLEALSSLVRDIDDRTDAAGISAALLDALCDVFGFDRGVVLASPRGEPDVVASRGVGQPAPTPAGVDLVIERAWSTRRAVAVRGLDGASDPRLATLLGDARNVLVVPLCVERDVGLGAVALSLPGRRPRLKRWVVALVEQYASHAALTLRNAWLREELERRLEENRALQERLRTHNERLEAPVQDRTRDLSESLRSLRIADGHRRRLLSRLVHAEEAERQRIAGDVHDDPIQKLSAASLRLQVLRRSLSEPAQRGLVDKAQDTVRASIASLRHLVFELRPHALDEEGLGPAIEQYLESLDGGFAFSVEDRLSSQPPPELRGIAYRIAQEALANVHKHARAGRVDVLLEHADGGVHVRIRDDGVGFAPAGGMRSAPGHLGLTAMRERAEMAGGRCTLESAPGAGTAIELWLPVGPADPAAPADPEADAGAPLRLDASDLLEAARPRG
jgi:signal transduction histidine kinase